MNKWWTYLLVLSVFGATWWLGACLGSQSPDDVAFHEQELPVCGQVFDWGPQFGTHFDCEFPAGANEICLHSTYNVAQGYKYWMCDDSRVPVEISGYQSINILMGNGGGDDKVVIRGVTSPLKGCSCSCDVDTAFWGAVVDFKDSGGVNPLGDLTSPVVRVYDMDWLGDHWDASNSGRDYVYGGGNRTRVYSGNGGDDWFKGGPREDQFSVWDEADTAKNRIWDTDGFDYWRTGSGNDMVYDDHCELQNGGGISCDLGPGAGDTANCAAQCQNEEIIGGTPEPACPALPFP